MSHSASHAPRALGHVFLPMITVGALSFALAMGLELLGLSGQFDAWIARQVSTGGEAFSQRLAPWSLGAATAVMAWGMAWVILATRSAFRRSLLWLTGMILIAAWAPVLSLAAYAPQIASPWIATAWAGLCALIYTARHNMPADEDPAP